jgi:HEAT repeat protein
VDRLPIPTIVDGWRLLEGGSWTLRVLILATVALTLLSLAFTGLALLIHLRTKRRDARRERLEAQWKHLLLAVIAGERSPSSVHSEIEHAESSLFLPFLIRYASRVRGEAKDRIRQLAHPFLADVVDKTDVKDPTRRAQALQRLGLLGGRTYLSFLRRGLKDSSDFVAVTSLRWLTELGEPDDAAFILDHLDRLSDLDIRQLASALVELGPDAAPHLRSALRDPTRPEFTHTICAESLRWMNDGKAADIAADLLRDDPPDELAAALLRLVRRVGRPEHASLVRTYCAHDVFFVRIHAARALGQIGGDADVSLLNTLVLEDPSWWVALNAAKSLNELGTYAMLRRLCHADHERSTLAQSVLPKRLQ